MKMKSMNRITRTVVVGAILCIVMAGAFSYFTDYESKQLSAKAGTLTLAMTDATQDLTNGLTILNPGDSNDLTFTANNTGEKSMDVKAVITVVSSREMNVYDHQYKVTSNDGEEVNGVLSGDKRAMVYTIEDITLSGSVEEDGEDVSHTYDYQFVMDDNADNSWQDTDVDVTIELFAKQHRNTSGMGPAWTHIVELE